MNKRDPGKLFPHDYLLKPLVSIIPGFIQPNHVTAFRMALTPFVLLLLYFEDWRIGIPLFIFAAFTDALDGSMARIRKAITPWGTFYDPVADKVLVSLVVLLVAIRIIHPIILVTIVSLEVLIMAGGWFRARKNGGAEAANVSAKVKMVFQVVGVGFALLALGTGVPAYLVAAQIILVAAIALALVSLVTYSL